MKYIKVYWIQNDPNYPVEILSEIDDERFEVKKVEIYPNNVIGYASNKFSRGKTILGECPIPLPEEINEDSQFEAKEITEDAFYAVWNKCMTH